MKTLDMLKLGEQGLITGITAQGEMKRHFLDMGITTGVPITLAYVAPFGDPIAVRVRGYTLSLRREEAKKIRLQ